MTTQNTKKIVYGAALSAIAIVLAYFVRFPIFPAASFLEYDMADVPIFIGTMCYGTGVGLMITVVVSVLQGLIVSSQSGWVGIIMHILATGTFVVVAGGMNKMSNEKSQNIISLLLGCFAWVLVMIPLNLVFSSFFYFGVPLDSAFIATLKAIVSFPREPLHALVTGVGTALAFCASLYASFLATGVTSMRKKGKTQERVSLAKIIIGFAVGIVFAMLVALPLNLLFGGVRFPAGIANDMNSVVAMIWTAIVPFNAIKAFGNAMIAFLVNTQVSKLIRK